MVQRFRQECRYLARDHLLYQVFHHLRSRNLQVPQQIARPLV